MEVLAGLWTFATAWYNVPFTLALLACLVLAALQFVGLGQDHDAGAHADLDHGAELDHDVGVDHDLDHDFGHDLDHDIGHDVDHDLDHDLDHDVDHDLDHDAGHDLDHEAAHDVSHGGELPAWAAALRFLGAGQAPITMILLVLLGGFGIFGWIMNGVVVTVTPAYPGLLLLGVLGADAVIGALFTSRVARFLGQAVPAFSSTATSVKRLVGRRGHVATPQVDERYGQVKVRDIGGTLITVFAVVDAGKPPIPRDAEVVLVEYDETKRVFVVVPSEM